jgi:hypothetical protein
VGFFGWASYIVGLWIWSVFPCKEKPLRGGLKYGIGPTRTLDRIRDEGPKYGFGPPDWLLWYAYRSCFLLLGLVGLWSMLFGLWASVFWFMRLVGLVYDMGLWIIVRLS